MIASALFFYAAMVIGSEIIGMLVRRARRRDWERQHPGLRWKDWENR